jgi:hypothetical protein
MSTLDPTTDITVPITTLLPGSTVHTPGFGDIVVAPSQSNTTVVLHIDAAAASQLQSIFSTSAPVTQTAEQLGEQYGSTVLTAALQIALKAGR